MITLYPGEKLEIVVEGDAVKAPARFEIYAARGWLGDLWHDAKAFVAIDPLYLAFGVVVIALAAISIGIQALGA